MKNSIKCVSLVYHWFRDYDSLSLMDKVDMGVTSALWRVIFGRVWFFIIICLILAVIIWKKYDSVLIRVTGVCLSRNKGHQNVLLAGLMTAKEHADIVISMDAELQDDVDTVYNHADYRLMSKRALNELAEFKEVNLFLRGIIPMIGFKTAVVEYERNERFAGESKYPLSKMISFAVEGITSCSVKPLRMITTSGLVVFLISIIYLIYVIIGFCMGRNIQGWTTTVVLICLFGGAQILCLGVIGEYVGKIYNEVKQRPRFIISEKLLK